MILETTINDGNKRLQTDPPTDSYFLLTVFDDLPTIS